ncbi:MAG: hypothetical protein JWO88_3727 [Frankiales bacterium]|nr:hypothetical protein [Frankiales bacterium]
MPSAHVTNGDGNGAPPHESALRAAILVTLRSAVRLMGSGTFITQAELRHSLRPICADAHRRNLRAEQLLLLMKAVWSSMPDTSAAPGAHSRRELFEHVITAVLDEFYQESSRSD